MSTSLHDLLSQAPDGIEWAALREVREEGKYLQARDGKPEQNVRRSNHGIFCEVLFAGQFAYAATCDLTKAGVKEAFNLAYEIAKQAAPAAVFKFDATVRPASVGRYCSPGTSVLSKGNKAFWDLLISSSLAGRVSSRIVSSSVLLWVVESTNRIVSTSGADIVQQFHFFTSDCMAVAAERGEVQTRSEAGHLGLSFQGGAELLSSEAQFIGRSRKVAEQAEELLLSPQCEQGVFDLLLAPDQMALQIHESIGHPLEMDRILADERNFAGWSFVRKEDFGKLQYGSALLNITFDSTDPKQFASFAFDDHGSPAEKEYLIKNGILLRGLGGSESQRRLGVGGVSCTRASGWNRPAVDRMANINLEAGSSTFEEMVQNVERGVYMETNRSWSIDDYRRKFQFGCEYAKEIKAGKITHTVRNPNYRGVTLPFWNSLAMLGDKNTFKIFGIPSCGKGEPQQMMRVGHASPACLFKNVEIFGGAKK